MDIVFDDLRDTIGNGKAIIVVGAGVPIGATDNASVASWTGLLRGGVQRCIAVVPSLPSGWGARVSAQIPSNDVVELLSAAENVSVPVRSPRKLPVAERGRAPLPAEGHHRSDQHHQMREVRKELVQRSTSFKNFGERDERDAPFEAPLELLGGVGHERFESGQMQLIVLVDDVLEACRAN